MHSNYRRGKSVGTWEPSSQKVFKVAERNLRFQLIFRICVMSSRILNSLRGISVTFEMISFNTAWIHGLKTIIPFFPFDLNVKVIYFTQKDINLTTRFPESVLTFSTSAPHHHHLTLIWPFTLLTICFITSTEQHFVNPIHQLRTNPPSPVSNLTREFQGGRGSRHFTLPCRLIPPRPLVSPLMGGEGVEIPRGVEGVYFCKNTSWL